MYVRAFSNIFNSAEKYYNNNKKKNLSSSWKTFKTNLIEFYVPDTLMFN